MHLRLILFALASAWPAAACSCGNYEPLKACQLYQRTPVIFRGRVIDHNDDGSGRFVQMTLYRFQVLEAFKGLAPDTKEVFIDPASMTSCYTQFEADREYLVYTGGAQPEPAAVTILSGRQSNLPPKPVPEAWKGKEQLPVYTVGGCSPTRVVREGDQELAYLRSAGAFGADTLGWIEGVAAQNFGWPYEFKDFVPAIDARLTLTAFNGKVSMIAVGADGKFKLDAIPPGAYQASATSAILGAGKLRSSVEVPPGGCGVANITFETHSGISGRVLDASGKPASGIRLELGELRPEGKVCVIPDTWVETDESGNFAVPNVPMGRIVLAANLNGAPTSRMPFDATYIPETQDLKDARVFTVRPGQQVTGVTLRLPKPLAFAILNVEVTWPDGSPALEGARAFAEWNGARADFERAEKASGRVSLRLALNRPYKVGVDWYWMNWKPGDRSLFVEGAAPQMVDFTHDGQSVTLRLKTSRPR